MPLTVFDTKGVPATRRERIEAAVVAGGKHIKDHYEAWIATDPRVNLGDDNHSIFSNGGTALMVHAKADDMKSDPAGNAGDRIACGLITK